MLVLRVRRSGQQIGGRRLEILQGSLLRRQGDLDQKEAEKDVPPCRILADPACTRFDICQTIVFMFTSLVKLKWQGDNQQFPPTPSELGWWHTCRVQSEFTSVSASTLLRGGFGLVRPG